MKRLLSIFLLLSIILTSCGGVASVNNLMKTNNIVPGLKISAATTDIGTLESFSNLMWKLVSTEQSGKNSLISPMSAYIALAMCANGAKGDTLDAFSALGYSEEQLEEVNNQIAALIARVSDTEGSTVLNIANSIWLDDSFSPDKSYLSRLAGSFAAEAFNANLPSAVGKINSWIENKTNGLIKDMLSELSQDAIAVLVNTLYMKAKWSHTFDPNDTYERSFNNADGSVSKIDFMNNGIRNEYVIDNADFEGVMLPYDDDKLAFVALMPKNSLDTTAAVGQLTKNYKVSELLKSAKYENTKLALPKFELETSQKLNQMLCDMGLEIAFDPEKADFSGMGTAIGNIYISVVLQNAVLKLDEEGTEAAAATVILMETASAMPTESRELIFDRPFVYAVVERETGAILFCGEYNHAE